jgi:hypothetical protein
MSDYAPSKFPDSTKSIQLAYRNGYETTPRIAIDLVFSLDKDSSEYRVTVEGASPREIAVGLGERIEQLLAPHRRMHGFLHVGGLIELGRFLAILTGGILLLVDEGNPESIHRSHQIGAVLVVACGAHWFASKFIRPYVIFDSTANARRSQLWIWLVFGILGFILFGSLLPAARREYFGF